MEKGNKKATERPITTVDLEVLHLKENYFAISYLEILLLEDERCCEFASFFGEVDLNKPVSLLPGRLPKGPIGLPYNNESLLVERQRIDSVYRDIFEQCESPLTKYKTETYKYRSTENTQVNSYPNF